MQCICMQHRQDSTYILKMKTVDLFFYKYNNIMNMLEDTLVDRVTSFAVVKTDNTAFQCPCVPCRNLSWCLRRLILFFLFSSLISCAYWQFEREKRPAAFQTKEPFTAGTFSALPTFSSSQYDKCSHASIIWICTQRARLFQSMSYVFLHGILC